MLSLYTKTPNTANGNFYYYTDKAPFINWLGTPYCTVADNSFDIINGGLRISANGTFLSKSAEYNADARPLYNVSYIMHTQQDGERRFYNVLSVDYISGMYVLDIAIDTWASYIDKASCELFIERTNLDIGNYTLAPIEDYEAATPSVNNSLFLNALFDSSTGNVNYDNDLAIVLRVLTHTGVNSVFGNNSVYSTKLIGARLSGVNAPGLSGVNLWKAAQLCGTITNTQKQSDTDWKDFEDITITAAWVVPTKLLSFTPSTYRLHGTPIDISNISLFLPDRKIITIDCSSLESFGFAKYDYFAGTLEKSIKLQHGNNMQVDLRCITDNANIEIHLIQGANDVDVTELFSIPFTANDGNLTTLDKIKDFVAIGNGAINAGLQIAQHNYVGALQSTANTAVGLFNEGSGRYVNGGNAISTFLTTSSDYSTVYKLSLGTFSRKSKYDETLILNENGAYYNSVKMTLSELMTKSDFAGGISIPPHRFVKTSKAIITGVPATAAQAIAQTLASGVKIIVLK